MGNESYLQKLSENQYLAIKQKGNVLLTAIPGSGKTRTLTNKILYEYSEKEYKKIVAITYTNRASEEMIERIRLNLTATLKKNGQKKVVRLST